MSGSLLRSAKEAESAPKIKALANLDLRHTSCRRLEKIRKTIFIRPECLKIAEEIPQERFEVVQTSISSAHNRMGIGKYHMEF